MSVKTRTILIFTHGWGAENASSIGSAAREGRFNGESYDLSMAAIDNPDEVNRVRSYKQAVQEEIAGLKVYPRTFARSLRPCRAGAGLQGVFHQQCSAGTPRSRICG
jgi:hypothetical protein